MAKCPGGIGEMFEDVGRKPGRLHMVFNRLLAAVPLGKRQDIYSDGRDQMMAASRASERALAGKIPLCQCAYDSLYEFPLFDAPMWYRPDQAEPVGLFPPS